MKGFSKELLYDVVGNEDLECTLRGLGFGLGHATRQGNMYEGVDRISQNSDWGILKEFCELESKKLKWHIPTY